MKPGKLLYRLQANRIRLQHRVQLIEEIDESERNAEWQGERTRLQARIDQLTRQIEQQEKAHETSNRIGG